MRVLLVNPPKRNFYRRMHFALPPLGVAYVAAALRQAGHDVRIADLDAAPRTRPDLARCDLVGISVDTIGYPAATAVAAEAGRLGKPVLMGGYHVSFQDEHALRHGGADYVLRGEVERTVVDLVEALEGRRPLHEVPSLSFLRGGRVVRTPLADPPQDLDALPLPARDLLPLRRYRARFRGRRLATVITSRGCPFRCSFCVSSRFAGARWRARSPGSVVEELRLLRRRYGYRAVAFMDDNFTLDVGRARAICREIRRHEPGLIWWCFSRADTIAQNEPLVRDMARAGCRQVFLGLESGDEHVLADCGKRLTVRQQDRAMALLRRCGIHVHGSFILGHPGETWRTALETIRRARTLGLAFAQFSLLTPYPGTDLFRQALRQRRLLHTDWRRYDGLHAVLRHDRISPGRLQQLLLRAYREFYARPAMLLAELADLLRFREPPGAGLGRLLAFLALQADAHSYLRRLKPTATQCAPA